MFDTEHVVVELLVSVTVPAVNVLAPLVLGVPLKRPKVTPVTRKETARTDTKKLAAPTSRRFVDLVTSLLLTGIWLFRSRR
jgi:hypothetical protein